MGRAFRLVEVAGGEDHRGTLGGGARDQRPQVSAADRVYPGGRLVQDQQGRVVQHRGDDAQLLAHPARQPPGQPVPRARQPGPVQVLLDPRARRARRDLVGGRTEGQVLGHGQVGVRARARGQVADLDPRRARDRTPARGDGPAQAAQQRGPARSVPADHRADLTRAGLAGHLVQGQPVTVADGHGVSPPGAVRDVHRAPAVAGSGVPAAPGAACPPGRPPDPAGPR